VKAVWGEPDVCPITTLAGDSKPLLIMNMQGPCVARSRTGAATLIVRELDLYRGRAPLFIVPCEQAESVRQLYDWGVRNCELHLCQVRGKFQPFRGVSMPSFLPGTG